MKNSKTTRILLLIDFVLSRKDKSIFTAEVKEIIQEDIRSARRYISELSLIENKLNFLKITPIKRQNKFSKENGVKIELRK